jgi:hypothetical protein
MKNKTYSNILRTLLAAFVIITTGAALTHAGDSAQPTKPNPFDSINSYVMYSDDPVTFEDNYSLFFVNFTNLMNYQPVLTEGCSILEIHNMTENRPIDFYLTADVSGYEDPYITMPTDGEFGMNLIWVYGTAFWDNGTLVNYLHDGDLLRIRFKIPNDIEYESPVFELYVPYSSDACLLGSQEYYWD